MQRLSVLRHTGLRGPLEDGAVRSSLINLPDRLDSVASIHPSIFPVVARPHLQTAHHPKQRLFFKTTLVIPLHITNPPPCPSEKSCKSPSSHLASMSATTSTLKASFTSTLTCLSPRPKNANNPSPSSKYYPPDFDPSAITRTPKHLRNTGPKVITVRLMAPFSMKCTHCGMSASSYPPFPYSHYNTNVTVTT